MLPLLAAFVIAQAGPGEALAQPRIEAPAGAAAAAPPLPEGPLLAVAAGGGGETFLLTDTPTKRADLADFWTYETFVPPLPISEGRVVVQGLTHHLVDCEQSTDERLSSYAYDEAGAVLVSLGEKAAAPMDKGGPYALVAKVLCRGDKLPDADAVRGHGAALAQARAAGSPAAPAGAN
jgi:hypothetical protein